MTSDYKPKTGSLKAMGLRAFMDDYYSSKGGYTRFEKMIVAGFSDAEMAKLYGRSRQTINGWRKLKETENDERSK
jgi:hypothetical protein